MHALTPALRTVKLLLLFSVYPHVCVCVSSPLPRSPPYLPMYLCAYVYVSVPVYMQAFWPGYRFLEQVKWKTCGKRGGAMNSGAAVSNGMVVMNNYDGIIRGIAQHSGKIVWEFKTGAKNSGGGSATIVGGIAYIGSWDRHLYALELATGKEVWKFDAKGEIESHPAYQEGDKLPPSTLCFVNSRTPISVLSSR